MLSYNSLYKEKVKKITITIFFMLLVFQGCAVKQNAVVIVDENKVVYKSLSAKEKKSIKKLYNMLIDLAPFIDKKEADKLAHIAVLYPIYLSKKYKLIYPPLFHNFLVNIHLKDRGLCYQWVEDMLDYIQCSDFKSFDFYWGVANRGKIDEHNVVVVTAKGKPFESGIILDAWRDSGTLFFAKVKDDKKYRFKEWRSKSRIYGCIP